MAKSALNNKSKRKILTQECLRRIRNTKKELGEEVRNEHLNKFMLKLKNSGYSQTYRKQILDSALKAYEKMVADDLSGKKPLYRSRDWDNEDRNAKKNDKKLNWWKNEKSKIKYTSTLFVPPTPGGKLAKELRNREEDLNKYSEERIKIVETGGIEMESILTNKNPFKSKKCDKEVCPLCKNGSKIPCNTNNIGYRWTCKTCRDRKITKVYEGESSRSARIRGAEHLRDYENKKEKSVLYKHKILDHKTEEPQFEMKITGTFRDALTRQANEAVRIQRNKPSESLNSKCEFNSAPVARVTIEKQKTNRNFKPNRRVPT